MNETMTRNIGQKLTRPNKPEKPLQHLNMARDLLSLAVHIVKLALGVVGELLIKKAFFGVAPGRQGSDPRQPNVLGDDHVAAVLFVVHPEFAATHMEDHEEGCCGIIASAMKFLHIGSSFFLFLLFPFILCHTKFSTLSRV